jgi:CBS domain-containing protein
MKIREILGVKGTHVHSIGAQQTVLDAVAVLMEHRIGALLVRDAAGGVAGLISERDVLRECLHRSAELGRIAVQDAMTQDLVVCVLDDDLDYAMGIMTKNRVRHLPVMDGERVAGMISIGDLVKARLEESEYENRYLRDYIAAR